MLKSERQQAILAALRGSGRVVATELQQELGVSAYTIRRDLDELAESGALQRVHGGALAVARSGVATTFAGRGEQSVAGKRAVGRAAAALLTPGAVTILDGGSTAVAVAEALTPGYSGTIVTHSIPAAAALADHDGVEVVLVGGTLERRAMVAVGADCINTYKSIRADMVLLGVWALHAEHGLSEGYREEAEVRRVLLGCGDRVVGLATADKLGTVAPFGFGPADALTHLVTERDVADAVLDPLRALGVQVVRP